MYKVILSLNAKNDISNVLIYTKKIYGQKQARVYSESIKEALNKIAELPSRGHFRRDIPKQFLAFPCEQHLLIYRIEERTKEIRLYRFLHIKMDFTDRI